MKGISALQLGRDLGVQYKTAFVLAHKIRESLMEQRDDAPLSGEEPPKSPVPKPAPSTESEQPEKNYGVDISTLARMIEAGEI